MDGGGGKGEGMKQSEPEIQSQKGKPFLWPTHVELYSDLLQALQRTFHGSRVSTKQILMCASAVLHRRITGRQRGMQAGPDGQIGKQGDQPTRQTVSLPTVPVRCQPNSSNLACQAVSQSRRTVPDGCQPKSSNRACWVSAKLVQSRLSGRQPNSSNRA